MQVLCFIGSGASLVSIFGGQIPLSTATRSILGAVTCKDCLTTRLLTSGCSNAAYKELLPLCSGS